MSKLFDPWQVGPYVLPNRVVMAPMTRCRATSAGVPTPLMAEYYAQRASAGLLITEASQVSPRGTGYPQTPGMYHADQVAGWQRITAAVHERGGRIFAQLWHVGRISHPAYQADGGLPWAPSAVAAAGKIRTFTGPEPYPVPHAMTLDEIRQTIAEFRHAAQCALDAGFDGVELHGANGYLPDQFLRDGTNRRTDEYGGSIENRARFHLEVTRALCDVWGAERVGVRLSPSGTFNDMTDSQPLETFSHVVRQLGSMQLCYLHIMEAMEGDMRHGGQAFPVHVFRPLFSGNLITNAGFTLEKAEQYLAAGWADAVAWGVLFLANPDLPERFRRGTPLNAPDPATFYGGDHVGYTDYPALDAGS